MNAISNVYNYYVTTQPRRQQANKYDTHKKSELKDIYNSIVKMSKESPVYIYEHSQEAYQFAINIKEEARELKNTLSALTSEADSGSMFGQRIATSSDEEAVSVNYLGAKPEENETGFSIQAEQLAEAQTNTGHYLSPGKLKLMPATYTFDIQTGGLSYEFQFKVSHQDTNKSIQERLASLINKSGIGIHGEVITNEDGFTALSLTSEATGSNNGKPLFQISDSPASQPDGSVSYLGLDRMSNESKDAVFTLDGNRHTASSNTFTVNKDFEISLLAVTDEPVQIGFKADIDTVSDNIKDMTQKYNSLIRLSGSYADEQIRAGFLRKNISSAVRKHENSLESIGLQLTADGAMNVDDQLLNQALSEDMAETVDSLVELKSTLIHKTEEVMLNPMDYVDKKIVAYPNPGKTFANPYLTSIYSGMLFNSYC